MFLSVFQFDLKSWLRYRPFYLYALALFAFGFVFLAGMAAEDEDAFGGRTLNSLFFLYGICRRILLLLLLLLPAVVGYAAVRDYRHESRQLFFAFPLRRLPYLAGRFSAAFLVVLFLLACLAAGLIAGSLVPWANPKLIAPFDLRVYLQLFGGWLIPNFFFAATLVFSVALLTRSVYPAFFAIAGIILLRTALVRFFPADSHPAWVAIMDPLGLRLFDYYSEQWTVQEQNTLLLPLNYLWWINRTAIVLLGGMILLFSGYRFRFSVSDQSTKKQRPEVLPAVSSSTARLLDRVNDWPPLHPDFSFPSLLWVSWQQSVFLFRVLSRTPLFLAALGIGLSFLLFLHTSVAPRWGTESLPMSHLILGQSAMFYAGFINAGLFLFAGWLVHRDRQVGVDPLLDSQPLPNWTLLLARTMCLAKILLVLLALPLISGVAVQCWRGYFSLDLDHYVVQLFVLDFLHFLPWALLGLLVHVWLQRPFFAFLLLCLIPVGAIGFAEFAPQFLDIHFFQHPVFRYNQSPSGVFGLPYSAIDGYGRGLSTYLYYRLLWIVAGTFFLWVGLLLWRRGIATPTRDRWSLLLRRIRQPDHFSGGAIVLGLTLLLAFFPFQRDFLDDDYFSRFQQTAAVNAAIKQYRFTEGIPQARIRRVDILADLYPSDGRISVRGHYLLVNDTEGPLDTIVVNGLAGTDWDYSFNSLPRDYEKQMSNGTRNDFLTSAGSLSEASTAGLPTKMEYRYISRDTIAGLVRFDILQLEQPLSPGDSLLMYFSVRQSSATLLSSTREVRREGTFVRDDILPRLGNWLDYFRRELSLGTAAQPPLSSDPERRDNATTSRDSDRIDYRVTLSTEQPQTAVSTGRLTEQWSEGGRNFFTYRSERPMAHSFLFLSGNYAVVSDHHRGVEFSVFHYPEHDRNITDIMSGMRAAFDYCSDQFGPYPFGHLRTVEFAQTGGVSAHGYPGTMPAGEGSGFLADYDPMDTLATNYAFGTAAHETAHQWWGNLVMAADARGSKLIVESLADYVNVMVSRRAGRRAATDAYLRGNRKKYLLTRNRQREVESPLVDGLPTHPHLFYQKGVQALVTIAELLGEDQLNGGIRNFYRRHRQNTGQYPTAGELVDSINAVTPDSLRYLINDFFRTITLYDNQLTDWSSVALPNGYWQLNADVSISKYREAGEGRRVYADKLTGGEPLTEIAANGDTLRSLPLADWLEIAVYDEEDHEIYRGWHRFDRIKTSLSLRLGKAPARVSVDPRRLFFDTNDSDNER